MSRPLRPRHAIDELLQGGRQVLRLGHVGAQVVQRLADLADHARDLRAQVLQRGVDRFAPLGCRDRAVDLEAEVRERRPDVVVQVAGDAVALLVGGHDAEALEQPGVVDGDAERFGEPVEDLGLLLTEVVRLERLDSDQSDHRAARSQRRVQTGLRAGARHCATSMVSSSRTVFGAFSASSIAGRQIGASQTRARRGVADRRGPARADRAHRSAGGW